MSKTTTTILIGAVLVASGTALYQWTEAQRAETELAALRVERDGLRSQFAAEQQRSRRSTQEAIALQTQVEALQVQPAASATPAAVPAVAPATAHSVTPLNSDEVAVLRRSSLNKAIVNNLRVISAARDQFQRDHGRAPASLDDLVGEGKYIPAFVPVNGEDYSTLSLASGQPLTVLDHDGANVTYDPSAPSPPPQEMTPAMQQAQDLANRLKPAVEKAIEAFRAANNGAMPPNPAALVPYFATPQESTDFTNLLSISGGAR
jgi:hypothetical protein